MSIQFDQAEDAKNTQKHGVSLAAAAGFEWMDAVTWPDQRQDYGEDRRIISLRKANQREVKRYAET
jgi:uncharacterized DUF497 family protein